MFQCTKEYRNYPCTHRQHRHDGHCSFVHGYSRSFKFTFAARVRDKCGFVVDYGKLKALKQHLDYMFDHTFLVNEDDPHIELFREMEDKGIIQLREMFSCGMEGTAEYLFTFANDLLKKDTDGRAWVVSVESRENDKNASTYFNPEIWSNHMLVTRRVPYEHCQE